MCVKTELKSVMDDLLLRAEEGDENLQKGLRKFITAYNRLICGPAPSAAVASALHHFGRNYSKRDSILNL
jgi:hypothetical protein